MPIRRPATIAIAIINLATATGWSQATGNPEYSRAVSTLYGSVRLAEFLEQWCAERTPEFKASSAEAHQSWLEQQGVLDIRARLAKLEPSFRTNVDATLGSSKATFYAKLDGIGRPGAVCRDLAGFFAKYLDLKTQYPAEYRVIASHSTDGPSTNAAPVEPAPTAPVTAVRAGDNKGITPADIDGVYLEQNTGFGVGGMVIIRYDPVLMLKDGWAYDAWTASPADLDVTRSRQLEPKGWRRYQRRGDQIRIQDHQGVWSTFGRWHQVAPARPGDRIVGSFSHLGGGGNTAYGGSTMIAVSNSFTFNRDGTFKSASAVGVSGGNEATDPNGPPGVVATSQRSSSGTYALDGYTLELRYGNGRVIRRAFLWFDEKERDSIFLDGTAFLLDK